MAIEINNLTRFKIDKKSFAQVAKKVLSGENRETESLSLAFVNKQEMQGLNKKFRGKNTPTDVLAFGNVSRFTFHVLGEELGEVVICPEVVKEKKEDMTQVFIHGILHLLGYEHEESKRERRKMEEREKQYLKNF